ncbi:uncharacterized protein FIBRA_04047 [Fibroporia radiculosa]|uniref:BZIP domain-containing protein n=1 Tax=Fibroporia radiculosa TaxID=599839 RepID=J4H2R3_9APHY|nr:uncharacterized protein FIBRA_04047 [Fibroporia radiculosa]CCM01974.1 predicted protein [Fibroporia radiculosa]
MPPSPSTSPPPKTGSDDSPSRMSEAALRKKKNADAQAAFRARRANYIATLEETVTNLEAVVIELQDSCRKAKHEIQELRQENARLKQELRQRDRTLKRVWQGRSVASLSPQSDDFSSAPPYHPHPSPSLVAASMAGYTDNPMRYAPPPPPDQSMAMATSFHHSAAGTDYIQRSPALTFASSVDTDTSPDLRSQQMDPHRMPRYDQYAYHMDPAPRDTPWMRTDPQNGPSPGDVLDSGSSSHSPNYIESPTLTSSELGYPSQFPLDEQKVSIAALNNSYMFSSSRSISPAVSTPTSTSSTSLAPVPFPFTFPEGTVAQDRPEFGYRRHGQAPQLTLHGGTADISVAASSRDVARYRPNILTDPPIAQALSRVDNGSGGRNSDDSEAASYTYSRSRQRSETGSTRASRSPSPAPPPLCGTLAVIKAQAFGALRRTRTRSRKTSEGAAKAAVQALEARGIGMGITIGAGSKRPRLLVDDGDMQA